MLPGMNTGCPTSRYSWHLAMSGRKSARGTVPMYEHFALATRHLIALAFGDVVAQIVNQLQPRRVSEDAPERPAKEMQDALTIDGSLDDPVQNAGNLSFQIGNAVECCVYRIAMGSQITSGGDSTGMPIEENGLCGG